MNLTIQRLIDSHAPLKFFPGVKKSEIARYEQEEGITIPTEYREWLMFSDGGEIFVPGTRLYGIGIGAEKTLVTVNAQEERYLFALDSSLLIVGTLNFGDLLCLDLSSGEVVQWDHEDDEEYLRWDSFFNYLDEEIKSYLGEDS